MESDYDRGSAVLTPKQRAYIRGESDIEPNTSHERVIRSRIRDRLRESLLDLSLLHNTLPPDDLVGAFEDPELTDENYQDVIHMFNRVAAIFALLFDGLSRTANCNHATEAGQEPDDRTVEMFEDYVTEGLSKMYQSRGLSVQSIETEINVELQGSISELAEKQYSELSKSELDELLYAQEITPDEYAEALQQMLGTEIKHSEMPPPKALSENDSEESEE